MQKVYIETVEDFIEENKGFSWIYFFYNMISINNYINKKNMNKVKIFKIQTNKYIETK